MMAGVASRKTSTQGLRPGLPHAALRAPEPRQGRYTPPKGGSPGRARPMLAAAQRSLWSALAVVWLLQACGDAPSPTTELDLEPVPHPDLSTADSDVREQLDDERAQFDAELTSDLEPDHLGTVYGVMGRLYHAHDFLGPAAAAYRNAVRLDPAHQHWHYYLGTLYQHLGRFEEAATELSAAAAVVSDAATLRRLGDVARARERTEEARDFYQRALGADPTCHAARFGLGETARDSGDLAAAAEHFRVVLAKQPDARLVHYPLAQTLLRLGQRDEAEIHLQASADRPSAGGLATCPDPLDDERQMLITGAPIHIARGRQAAAEGDAALELSEYRKAVELAPDLPLALQSLGHVLARRGETARAHGLYARAAEIEPENADLRHDLGLLSLSLGDVEQARQHLEAALELRPDRALTRLHLGRLVQQQGLAAEAMALYQPILDSEPTHPQARFQRAACLVQLGRHAEAAADLGRLLDNHPPPDAPNRLQIAAALAALGDLDRGLEHLQAVLDLDPDPATAARAHATLAALHEARGDASRAAEHRGLARNPG